jgi:hypothetical protein
MLLASLISSVDLHMLALRGEHGVRFHGDMLSVLFLLAD